ncbi:MAG: Mor transcription activator family protein [Thermodesulfobacteriota bacterium]
MDGLNFLAELEELLNREMGAPAGSHALKALCERHHGSRVYIPSATEIYRAWRNRQLSFSFMGDNHAELALEWGLTERQIRRIVNGG